MTYSSGAIERRRLTTRARGDACPARTRAISASAILRARGASARSSAGFSATARTASIRSCMARTSGGVSSRLNSMPRALIRPSPKTPKNRLGTVVFGRMRAGQKTIQR